MIKTEYLDARGDHTAWPQGQDVRMAGHPPRAYSVAEGWTRVGLRVDSSVQEAHVSDLAYDTSQRRMSITPTTSIPTFFEYKSCTLLIRHRLVWLEG